MAATTTKSKTKPSGRFSPEQVKQFLEQGNIQTMDDVQSALKDLFSQTLQAMLEGEMEHHGTGALRTMPSGIR